MRFAFFYLLPCLWLSRPVPRLPNGSVLQFSQFGDSIYAISDKQEVWKLKGSTKARWSLVTKGVRGPAHLLKGSLWCATWMTDDVVRIYRDGKVERIRLALVTPSGAVRRNLNRMTALSGEGNELWIAAEGFLLLYDFNRGKWQVFRHEELSRSDALDLHFFDRHLYLITEGGIERIAATGLALSRTARWAPARGKVIGSLRLKDGLVCMTQDDAGIHCVHLDYRLRPQATGAVLRKKFPEQALQFRPSVIAADPTNNSLTCPFLTSSGKKAEIYTYSLRARTWSRRSAINWDGGDPAAAMIYGTDLLLAGNDGSIRQIRFD